MSVILPVDPAAGADRSIAGTGTPNAVWRGSPAWQATPTVEFDELVPGGDRLLVIAPHPDDEILGSAALLAAAARAGRDVLVLSVTDGEHSHPGSQKWPPERLGPARFAEGVEAVGRLGLPSHRMIRLGFADGGLARNQAEVSRAVIRHLDPHDVVVTPWRYDGHPDHEIVAAAVIDALQALPLDHLEVPIWGLHWAGPDMLPWQRAVRLPLDTDTQRRKREAVSAFVSQLEPDETTGRDAVLPDWALDRLIGPDELYFR